MAEENEFWGARRLGGQPEIRGRAAEMDRDAHETMRDSPQLLAPAGDLHRPDAFLSASAAGARTLLSHEASQRLARGADGGTELPAPCAGGLLCRGRLREILPCHRDWAFLAGGTCLRDPLGFPPQPVPLPQFPQAGVPGRTLSQLKGGITK